MVYRYPGSPAAHGHMHMQAEGFPEAVSIGAEGSRLLTRCMLCFQDPRTGSRIQTGRTHTISPLMSYTLRNPAGQVPAKMAE